MKSAKRAMYAIISGANVSDEDLMTYFVGVHALLNSLRLTCASAHPTDEPPLTPKHLVYRELGGELALKPLIMTPHHSTHEDDGVTSKRFCDSTYWRKWMT